MGYHISDVINLWPGESYSPFSVKKSKKVMCSPSWHFCGFWKVLFLVQFFPYRPRALGICVGLGQYFARGGNVTWSTRATRKKEGYKQTPAIDWSTTPSYSQKSEKSEVPPSMHTFFENLDFLIILNHYLKGKTMQTRRVSCSAAFITIIWGGPPQIRCYQSLARK